MTSGSQFRGYKRDTSSWYPMYFVKIGDATQKRVSAERFALYLKEYDASVIEMDETETIYEGATPDGVKVILKRIEDGRKTWTSRNSKLV